jgi:hypothetical protein
MSLKSLLILGSATLAISMVVIWGGPCFAQTQQEDVLPEGEAVVASVVHGVKYPLENRFSIDVAFARYYGDRLASTWGLGVIPKYHINEKLWVAVPFYAYQSTAVDGVQFSSDQSELVALDPGFSFALDLGYDPVYGKFVLGNSIHHFRAGFNGGVIGMKMNEVVGNVPLDNGGRGNIGLGLQLGLQAQLQIGAKWTADLFSTLIGYQFQGLSTSANRVGWQYGLSLGRVF